MSYLATAWKIFGWISGIAFVIELGGDIIYWVNKIPDELQTTTTELPKPIYLDVFFNEMYKWLLDQFQILWVFLSLCVSVWVHLGHFGSIWFHLGQSASVWVRLGRSGFTWVHLAWVHMAPTPGSTFIWISTMKITGTRLWRSRFFEKYAFKVAPFNWDFNEKFQCEDFTKIV